MRGAACGVRFVVALALASTALAATAVAAVSPSQAGAETHLAAAGGSFVLSGHGFGHGRGMSQWGAYGMAKAGQTAEQILDFYYPGTQTTTLAGSPTMRILLTRADGTDVDVVAGLGNETVSDTASGVQLALPASIDGNPVMQWRASVDPSTGSSVLTGLWQGGWQPYPVGAQLATVGTLQFASDSGLVRVVYPDGTQRDYQGVIEAIANGGGLEEVNMLPLEDYLKGVVPHEAIDGWPAAALQAQAVAARTYAAVRIAGGPYDICDTTQCQVYTGVASYDSNGNPLATLEFPEANAAIAAVAGQVRTNNGVLVSTEYSSSDGGWTVGGGQPWEPAQADPWDVASPDHDWTTEVSAAAIESAYPSIGTPADLVVDARDGNGDWGGRVLTLSLDGSAGSVTVSGDAFRAAVGLRSTYWTVISVQPPVGGSYLHPLVPVRVYDSRLVANPTTGATGDPLGPGEVRTVQVSGVDGIPADADGVVLNVTVTDTTASSFLTVWPTIYPKPNASSLDWSAAGKTVANLVYSGLGSDGAIDLYNGAGSTSAIVDVAGYFEPADISGGLGFAPVTPNRVLDTRVPTVAVPVPIPLPPGGSVSVAVAGSPGVSPDAQAVLVNLTGTNPTAATFLTLYPSGNALPGTSNLNLVAGDTRPNAALGVLGGGSLSVYNNLGTTNAIIDVMGQYVPADGVTGQFVSVPSARLLDTRTTTGGHLGPLAAGETFGLQVLGTDGIPTAGVSAVILNVTAVTPTAPTYVTVWPGGLTQPRTSNLNAGPGTYVPNLVVSGVGAGGVIDVFNDLGNTHVAVDVLGWISG